MWMKHGPATLLVLCAVLSWLVAGCESREHVATPRDEGPVTVPQRIVSQTVLSDEILWELGAPVRSRVVAVSIMADDERYSRVAGRWPAALPRVRGSSEKLLSISPDLVIVADFTAAEARALLRDAGVRTLAMSGFDGFDDYRRHVRELAELVGARETGERVIGRFDRQLAEVRVDGSAEQRPEILSWIEGMVAGANTTFDDAARAAGYANVAALRGHTGHVHLSVEQVVAWNPEYIVTTCGTIPCEQAERALARRDGFSATRAAINDHIVAIPSRQLLAVGEGILEVVEVLVAARPRGDRP
jgi:ABC-type Fe3+-hydroxamate transport system substrate-binding protein